MINHMASKFPKGERPSTFPFLKKCAAIAGFIVFGLLSSLPSSAEAVELGDESRLVIHGFLSQAYANSSGGQFNGIPGDGTSDYRNAALQFRYNYSSKDAFVLQFSHTRVGANDLLQSEIPEVQLNWVFYQRQLLDTTSIKVGKFPVPLGIYNETLHVGTVLPFYRAPFMIYGDGAFSSETINGIGLYHFIDIAGSWGLEADLYAGEWVYLQQISGVVTATKGRNVLGTQLWLQTPIEGLRLGAAWNRTTDSNLPPPAAPTDEETAQTYHATVDANFERFLFQFEHRRDKSDSTDYRSYYGLAGVKLYDKLGLNVQAEIANLTIPGFVSNVKLSRDYAVGLRYAIRPDLVLKAEHHMVETLITEDPIIPLFADPIDVKYYIVSLSASF